MPQRIRDDFHPYAGREHERVLWEDRARLSFGNLVVDLAAYRVTVNGRQVGLPYFEFELLQALATRAGHIVSRNTLCTALWASDGPMERRRLNVLIYRLRTKLADSWPYRIETVQRRGYGLIAAEPLAPSAEVRAVWTHRTDRLP